MNVVSWAPRRSRLSSWSFPRLRSHPIQVPCPSFQTRRRWNRRKRSPPEAAGPWRRLRRAIPSVAAARSRSSSGIVSVGASVQSERRAKQRSPSALARKWISRRLTCSSISRSFVNRVGTTTRVRRSAGRPSRSSRRGRSRGPRMPMRARLISATARSEAGIRATRREEDEGERTHPRGMRGEQGEGQEHRREDADGGEVARRRAGHEGPEQPPRERNPVADLHFEERTPLGEEVVRRDLPIGPRAARRLSARRRGPVRTGDGLPGRRRARSAWSPGPDPRSRGGTGRGSRSPWRRTGCRRGARHRRG